MCSHLLKMEEELKEILGFPDIPPQDLGHEILGPQNNKTERKLATEKSQTDG